MSVAEFDATIVAADVAAVGGACVVNERTVPKDMPSALETMVQKK